MIPAREGPFAAENHFIVNLDTSRSYPDSLLDDRPVKFYDIRIGFIERFIGKIKKIEAPYGTTTLRRQRVTVKNLRDIDILRELPDNCSCKLTMIWNLLERHASREEEILHQGATQRFYVETEVIHPEEIHLGYKNGTNVNVVLCAIDLWWVGEYQGWGIDATSILDENPANIGLHVYSCTL